MTLVIRHRRSVFPPRPAAFGRPLAGLASPNEDGGVLIVGGADSGEIVLQTSAFDGAGQIETFRPSSADFADPDKLDLVGATLLSMAGLDYTDTIDGSDGPFAFLGLQKGQTGRVMLVDAIRYLQLGDVLEVDISEVEEFGSAVAPVRLQGGPVSPPQGGLNERRYDLVVGGRGAVVLFEHNATPGFWVDADGQQISGSGANAIPESAVLTIAVGNINQASDEDEIIISVPSENYVAIIDDVAGTPTSRSVARATGCRPLRPSAACRKS